MGIAVLVDEAHNLVDRGRGMYTAELDQALFHQLCQSAPGGLRNVLQRVSRHWEQLNRVQETDYQIYPLVPDLFIAALQKAVSAITDHLTEQPNGNERILLQFYLDAMLFCRLSEAYGPHSLFDITRQTAQALRHSGTQALRHSGTQALRHSGTQHRHHPVPAQCRPRAFSRQPLQRCAHHHTVFSHAAARQLLPRPARPTGRSAVD
jgi:hypothetical protein